MFEHKTIYKVTNLKVHSKGRYYIFFFIPFQELQRTARLDYKVVFHSVSLWDYGVNKFNSITVSLQLII